MHVCEQQLGEQKHQILSAITTFFDIYDKHSLGRPTTHADLKRAIGQSAHPAIMVSGCVAPLICRPKLRRPKTDCVAQA